MCNIGRNMPKNRFFGNGIDLHTNMPRTHVVTSRIVLLWSLTLKTWIYTPYNICSVICNICGDMKNRFFLVMVTLICIKMIRGTSRRLFNIHVAHNFLRIFFNLETQIKNLFLGGSWYPYLPTRLFESMWIYLDKVKALCKTL